MLAYEINPLTADEQFMWEQYVNWIKEHFVSSFQSEYQSIVGKLTMIDAFLKQEKIAKENKVIVALSLSFMFAQALEQAHNLCLGTLIHSQYGRIIILHRRHIKKIEQQNQMLIVQFLLETEEIFHDGFNIFALFKDYDEKIKKQQLFPVTN